MPVTINGTTGIAGPDGSASTPAVQGTDSNTGLFFPAADTVAITTGGTQRVTVDSSGNVGIGTSSPAYKLDVIGSSRIQSSSGYNFFFQTSGTTARINYLNDAFSANISAAYRATDFSWQKGDGSEILKLDSSGNLGLGVTPSAWNTSWKAIQIGSNSALASQGSVTDLQYNAYRNTSNSDTYISSDFATRYRQISGTHTWSTAAAGTANTTTITSGVSYTIITSGNQTSFGAANNNVGTVFTATSSGTLSSGTVSQNITFTQAMTLDASGNLGVGTTSPANLLHINGSNSIARFSGASTSLSAYQTFFNNSAAQAYFGIESSTGTGIIGTGAAYGMVLTTASTNPLCFGTNGTERARITSGGDLLVGPTSAITIDGATVNHAFRGTTGNNAFAVGIQNTGNSAPLGLAIKYTAAAPNGTGSTFFYCSDSSGVNRAEIRSNGGLANYSANNVNLSDRREKTNFAPAKSYLNTICAIPVQTFNYIDQSEDDPGLTLGVVAQDVQAVAPELVMESNWGTEENPKMRLSIYQTDLQYALMKCIQELKADLDATKAELAALKGA